MRFINKLNSPVLNYWNNDSLIDRMDMDILFIIILGILSLVLSYFGTLLIKRWALNRGVIDIPNQRSSHQEPTPRGGGMAIVASFLIIFLLAGLFQSSTSNLYWGLIINGLAISILGFLDDLYTLRRTPRIIAWIVITAVSIIFGIELNTITLPILGVISFGFLSPLITFLWLIGMTNLFNFMDGIDGIAGCEALITSGFLAGIAFYSGNTLVFSISVIIFGAALGFLPHNFPTAKIFMGDGGSNFLGYIFAALAIIGSQGDRSQIPFIIPVILLSMFLWDGGTTLIKRLPKGRDWLEPHRDHYYQRLIKLGFTHLQVTLFYSVLNLFLGLIAFFVVKTNERYALALIFFSVIPFLIVMVVTHRLENVNK